MRDISTSDKLTNTNYLALNAKKSMAYDGDNVDLRDYTFPNSIYLYNFILSNTLDTSDIASLEFHIKNNNALPSMYLEEALSISLFRSGRVDKSLTKWAVVKNKYPSRSLYIDYFLGTYYLAIKEYEQAALYLKKPAKSKYRYSNYYYALALSELQKWDQALPLWKSIASNDNIANKMVWIGENNSISFKATGDTLKWLYVHFYKNNMPLDKSINLISSINDSTLKHLAYLEINYYSSGQLDSFLEGAKQIPYYYIDRLWNYVPTDSLSSTSLYNLGTNNYPLANKGKGSFYLAKYYSKLDNIEKTIELYSKATKQSPYEDIIWSSYLHFSKDYLPIDDRYVISLDALRYNDDSPDIWKQYILLCLDLKYYSFAASGLEKFRQLVDNVSFQEFDAIYSKRLSDLEKDSSVWDF